MLEFFGWDSAGTFTVTKGGKGVRTLYARVKEVGTSEDKWNVGLVVTVVMAKNIVLKLKSIPVPYTTLEHKQLISELNQFTSIHNSIKGIVKGLDDVEIIKRFKET